MARFSFYIIDKTYLDMPSVGDARSKALEARYNEIREIEKKTGEAFVDSSNPFPEWIQELFKSHFKKAKFDRLNGQYKVVTKSDEFDDADEEYAKFQAAYKQAASETPERLDWYNRNHIQASITFEDEDVEMNKLEEYLGGKQPKEKRKH